MPLAQSKLARGMLPTEQTNDATATIGPTAAFSIKRSQSGPLLRKSAFHQSAGTSAARKPAIKKPPMISFQSIRESIQKALARRVHLLPMTSVSPELAAPATECG